MLAGALIDLSGVPSWALKLAAVASQALMLVTILRILPWRRPGGPSWVDPLVGVVWLGFLAFGATARSTLLFAILAAWSTALPVMWLGRSPADMTSMKPRPGLPPRHQLYLRRLRLAATAVAVLTAIWFVLVFLIRP